MIAYIDAHRDRFGVEPICKVLPIAPAAHYQASRRPLSARRRRDEQLKVDIRRLYEDNFGVYGARKMWRQLHREGSRWLACTKERLMGELGLQGVRRGKTRHTTTSEATSTPAWRGRLVQPPRLLEPIAHVPPAELEAAYHRREDPSRTTAVKARLL